MNDQEKSVLLVKAMGKYETVSILAVVDALVDGDQKHYWQNNGVIEEIPDLYAVDENGDPLHMPQAWQVLNWASEDKSPHPEEDDPIRWKLHEWLTFHVGWLDIQPAADAQRLWLDKILELVMESEK